MDRIYLAIIASAILLMIFSNAHDQDRRHDAGRPYDRRRTVVQVSAARLAIGQRRMNSPDDEYPQIVRSYNKGERLKRHSLSPQLSPWIALLGLPD